MDKSGLIHEVDALQTWLFDRSPAIDRPARGIELLISSESMVKMCQQIPNQNHGVHLYCILDEGRLGRIRIKKDIQ